MTISPTIFRRKMTSWLSRAAKGEDIGILFGDKVIALRPIEIESNDYAWTEYGLTKKEMSRIAKNLNSEIEKDRKAGKFREYHGDIEAMLKD